MYTQGKLYRIGRRWAVLLALMVSVARVVADTLPIEQRIAPLPSVFSQTSTQELEQLGNDYLLRRGEPDSAALCFTAIVQRYNDHLLQTTADLRSAISAMNGLEYLDIYYYKDFRRAIAYIIESQHVAEHIDARDRLPEIYIAIGDLHATLFNVSSASAVDTVCARHALDYFRRAYSLSVELQKWPQSVVSIINLLQIADDLGALDSIVDDVQHFGQQQIPDSVMLSRFAHLMCQAVSAKQQGDYPQALDFYERMLQAIDTDQTRGRCQLLVDLNKAKLYGTMGDVEKRFQCYCDLLPWAQENEVEEVQVDAYRAFADYYALKGKTDEAERNQLLYLRHKDSLLNVRHAADIEYIQVLTEWKEREAEIVTWSRRTHEQQTATWVAGLLAFLFLLGCAYLAWHNFGLRKRYRTLYRQNMNLLSDIEQERRKLAEQTFTAPLAESESDLGLQTDEATPAAQAEEPDHELQIRIRQVLELDEEVFSADFSVRRLADIVGEKYWRVSQVINDEWGKNFNTVLAEYRILEACRRINDAEHYGHLTIEGIAQSVGIKSRSNFSNTFKQIVGMPPSEYLKLARTPIE